MLKKSLSEKIAEALSRTKSWARGISVEWPDESCLPEKEKPVIRDFCGELNTDEFQRIQTDNPHLIFRNEPPHQKATGDKRRK